MKIPEIYKQISQPISLEIFPPKGDMDIRDFRNVLDGLRRAEPNFISVTYSAGGSGNTHKTADLAEIITKEYGISSCAHITCATSSKEKFFENITSMKSKGIENVLALRGDSTGEKSYYNHATDIIPILKENGFCVGGACYPEGHISCDNLCDDVDYLKLKQDVGASFLISQLFFDNSAYYRFLDIARKKGVNIPIIAGIMPMMSKSQVTRMIFMCGASLPSQIIRILNKYENNEDDLKKAGIEYAGGQLADLIKNGADGVHIYTMNRPDVAMSEVKYVRNAKADRA